MINIALKAEFPLIKLKAILIFLVMCMFNTAQAQFLAPYYPALQSNRGKGNGKLSYRIYQSSTASVFPATSAEFDSYLTTYNTYKAGATVKLAAKTGTTNSSGNYAVNLINFSSSSDLYTAIGTTTPYAGFTGDGFTVVVSGYFIPKQSGTYKFSIEGDDAVDLFINNTNVVNHYGPHAPSAVGTHTGTIALVAGKKYTFRARFMEGGGGEVLQVFWQKPSETSGSGWYQDVEELSSDVAVPSGLVLTLDAGNFTSYPQTGTTWFDLTGNKDGTIVGNTAFSSSDNGFFYLDGDQDYIDFGSNPPNFPTGNITVFIWLKATALRAGWNIFFSKWFATTSGSGTFNDMHYCIKWNGANYYQNLYTSGNSDMYGSTALTTNTWYYVGFTLVNGGNLQMYVNGQTDGAVRTGVSRTNYTSSSLLWLGDARSGGSVDLAGNIAALQIYNRAITPDEVLQNFNNQKQRYGY